MKSHTKSHFWALVLVFASLFSFVGSSFAKPVRDLNPERTRLDVTNESKRSTIRRAITNLDGRSVFSDAELEDMRSVLMELVDANYILLSSQEMFRETKSAQFDDLVAVRNSIQQLTAAELTSIRTSLDPAGIRIKLQSAFNKMEKGKVIGVNGPIIETAGVPTVDYFCHGQVEVLGISAPVSPGTLSASDDIFFIAEGVRDIAQNGCNQVAVVVVLGEGGGANTRLACNITDGIYLVAKALNQKYHFCDNDYDSSVIQATYGGIGHLNNDIANGIVSTASSISTSQVAIMNNATTNKNEIKSNDNANTTNIVNNDNTNKDTIVNNDNANRTTILNNDNTNRTTILNNDNANRNTIVSNDNANFLALTNTVEAALASIIGNANANKDEIKNLLLRTQIEADLSVNDGQPFIGLYQLPASTCFPSFDSTGIPLAFPQQCGLLDLVRSIVRQTIEKTGNDTNALRSFDRADSFRSQGKFNDAYKYYRKAYKEAVK